VRFVDAHVHLPDYQPPSRQTLAARATQTLLISQGTGRESSVRSVTLARSHPEVVRAFVGVHPSEAEKEPDLGWFEDALRGADGAGELGLDPKYSPAGPGSLQRKTFEAQLSVASTLGKPVQVHSRGSEKDCLELLSAYSLPRVLMHWFEGEALAKEVVDRGYFVSFGPALLYSNRLRRVASSLDPRLVLTESDGPVAFAPVRGAEGPSLIPSVVFELARIWKTGFEEAREVVLKNGLRYLGSAGKG
jgi:TatD DNase family protein